MWTIPCDGAVRQFLGADVDIHRLPFNIWVYGVYNMHIGRGAEIKADPLYQTRRV